MSDTIVFAAHAPDANAFWQDWIDAGICTAPYELTPQYSGVSIVDQTKDEDAFHLLRNADGSWKVPGWHANIRIGGPLVQQFTAGLAQTDANGTLLPLFQRTHAAAVFGLVLTPADPETNFPAAYCSPRGVCYADVRDISTPANVWA